MEKSTINHFKVYDTNKFVWQPIEYNMVQLKGVVFFCIKLNEREFKLGKQYNLPISQYGCTLQIFSTYIQGCLFVSVGCSELKLKFFLLF